MTLDILNQFAFPPEAKADFIEKGLVQNRLAPGVNEFQLSGFDKGIAYRFFLEAVPNKIKSEESGIEMFDEIEHVEWLVSRKHKPVERVAFLPDGLIKFRRKRNTHGQMELVRDEKGNPEVVGGIWAETYKAWKAGVKSPGLALSRWGKLGVGHVATLESEGVYTVEQFASMPRDRVEGRFPKPIVEAFETAIRHVQRELGMEAIKEQVDHVLELKQKNSKLEDELKALREQVQGIAEDRPKRGRPRKEGAEQAQA